MTKPVFEFETALRELEAITDWFESPDVDLDQGLTKFERGMELASQLKEHLESVENRVEKIKQRFSPPAPSVIDDQDQPPSPPSSDSQSGLF